MKNVKIFIGCIICCFCISMLQSYRGPCEPSTVNQITKVKYFYNPSSKQHYTLIITESSNKYYGTVSVHTQIIPGIIKPLN